MNINRQKKPELYIGTSGWSYDGWKDRFYQGIKHEDWLAHYSDQFSSVEVNASFYRHQSLKTLTHWAQTTPDDFRFTIKAHRYITHTKRLHEVVDAVSAERDLYQHLGDKLSCMLWQLPANFKKNDQRLEHFVQLLGGWPEVRHSVEFRHPSWFDDEVAHCLQTHHIAVCMSDAADWPMWEHVSADFVYIRLHGHSRTYASAYSRQHLQLWAEKINNWRAKQKSVYVYFDNDAEGAAPYDAQHLRTLIQSSN